MRCSNLTLFAVVWLAAAVGADASEWTRIGPDAAMVTALEAHPSDPEIALAGTDDAGIFRTQDGGESWSNAGLRGLGIKVIRFSESDPARVYAGLTGWPLDLTPGGVFVSDDGGLSWTAARSGLEDDYCPLCFSYFEIIDLAVDPTNSSAVWAATDHGLFTTTDGGDSWSRVPEFWRYDVDSVAVTSDDSPVVFVSWPHHGVVKSDDGGLTWSDASAGLEYLDNQGRLLLHSPYELVEAPWSAGMLFGSVDADLPFRYDVTEHAWSRVEASSRWLSCVVPGPQGSQDFWLGTVWKGVVRSTDSGESWFYPDGIGIDCEDPRTGHDSFLEIPVMAVFAGSGERVIAGTTIGSIVRSLDGGATWHPSSRGLSNSYPLSLLIDETDAEHMIVGTSWQGLFFTENGGDSWAEVLSHEVFPCNFWGTNPIDPPPPFCWSWPEIRRIPESGVIARGGCGTHVSFDRGANWQPAGEPVRWPVGHSNDDQVWYVQESADQILRGDGEDTNWQACGELPSAPYLDRLVEAVVFHDSAPDVALVGRYGGDAFRTEDGCQSWTQTGAAFAECRIYWLGADPDRPGRYLVSNSCGLWESTDEALTWREIDISQMTFRELLFDPARPDVVYALSNYDGVHYSTDRGASWRLLGFAPDETPTVDITLDPDGSALLVAVYGDGVYRLTLPSRFDRVRETSPQ